MSAARPPRVLLTGAGGFLGSHILDRLLDQGCTVAALLRPESDPWRLAGQRGRFQIIPGRLEAPEGFAAALAAFAPEAVIHAAWAGCHNRHHQSPLQADNVALLPGLMRTAAAAGARHWLALGSQAEYGPAESALGEEAPTRPDSAYGRAKLAALLVSQVMAAGLGLRLAWLRLFTAYGPRDDESWLIPHCIVSLLAGAAPAMTAGEQRWDYLYAADAAAALWRVLATPAAEGVFNLGSGRPVAIREVATRLRDLIDPALPLRLGELPYRPGGTMHLEADPGRLIRATGWQPATGLEDGLAATVAWYRGPSAARGSR